MDVNTKRCARCAETKSVAEFYRNKARRDGVGVYCMPCQKATTEAHRERQRLELIGMLGGKCVECGYAADTRALHVDHVNGGGSRERRAGIQSHSFAAIRQILASPAKFQLLCANCNIIKKLTVGEWVGERVYVRDVDQTGRLKRCPRCDIVQSASEFHKTKGRADGLSGHCIKCHRKAGEESHRRARAELLAHFGGECLECGYANSRALQVDHVDGGGAIDRIAIGCHPRQILRAAQREPSRYQLLCANCNAIKRITHGEHLGLRVFTRSPLSNRKLTGRAASDRMRTVRADERRAATLALIEERRPRERSDVRLPQGSWSRHYLRCLACGRSDREHAADGICYGCYARVKGLSRRIPLANRA